jgi:hypothetical protein
MAGTRTIVGFLQLPNELIYKLFELTRPFGFESFVLTLKRVYNTGKPPIPDQNFCKQWSKRIPGDMDGLLILRELLSAPPSSREWLLKYVTQLVVQNPRRMSVSECR